MKKFALAVATAATLVAVPATAQSAFVMIIGEAPRPAVVETDTPPSRETLIEGAVARACPAPFIRDLKRRNLHAECEAQARAEAEAVLAAREGSAATTVAMR
ncbi:hypothetical protein [Aurantiacibacter gilvus]|uniref:UrcA family protein n=1 Tax=Aurantiacibacter gilvus TaxID=3139141 RepID=A0ABU9IHZ7_9SPHN